MSRSNNRPAFSCTHSDGRYPNAIYCETDAAVLVSVQGKGIQYPSCELHLVQTIMERFDDDDRAKINVRNANTWHRVKE